MLAKTTEFIQSQHTLLFTIIEQNLFKRNRFHITLYILTPKLLFKYKSIIFCMLTGNNSGHQDFISTNQWFCSQNQLHYILWNFWQQVW